MTNKILEATIDLALSTQRLYFAWFYPYWWAEIKRKENEEIRERMVNENGLILFPNKENKKVS